MEIAKKSKEIVPGEVVGVGGRSMEEEVFIDKARGV